MSSTTLTRKFLAILFLISASLLLPACGSLGVGGNGGSGSGLLLPALAPEILDNLNYFPDNVFAYPNSIADEGSLASDNEGEDLANVVEHGPGKSRLLAVIDDTGLWVKLWNRDGSVFEAEGLEDGWWHLDESAVGKPAISYTNGYYYLAYLYSEEINYPMWLKISEELEVVSDGYYEPEGSAISIDISADPYSDDNFLVAYSDYDDGESLIFLANPEEDEFYFIGGETTDVNFVQVAHCASSQDQDRAMVSWETDIAVEPYRYIFTDRHGEPASEIGNFFEDEDEGFYGQSRLDGGRDFFVFSYQKYDGEEGNTYYGHVSQITFGRDKNPNCGNNSQAFDFATETPDAFFDPQFFDMCVGVGGRIHYVWSNPNYFEGENINTIFATSLNRYGNYGGYGINYDGDYTQVGYLRELYLEQRQPCVGCSEDSEYVSVFWSDGDIEDDEEEGISIFSRIYERGNAVEPSFANNFGFESELSEDRYLFTYETASATTFDSEEELSYIVAAQLYFDEDEFETVLRVSTGGLDGSFSSWEYLTDLNPFGEAGHLRLVVHENVGTVSWTMRDGDSPLYLQYMTLYFDEGELDDWSGVQTFEAPVLGDGYDVDMDEYGNIAYSWYTGGEGEPDPDLLAADLDGYFVFVAWISHDGIDTDTDTLEVPDTWGEFPRIASYTDGWFLLAITEQEDGTVYVFPFIPEEGILEEPFTYEVQSEIDILSPMDIVTWNDNLMLCWRELSFGGEEDNSYIQIKTVAFQDFEASEERVLANLSFEEFNGTETLPYFTRSKNWPYEYEFEEDQLLAGDYFQPEDEGNGHYFVCAWHEVKTEYWNDINEDTAFCHSFAPISVVYEDEEDEEGIIDYGNVSTQCLRFYETEDNFVDVNFISPNTFLISWLDTGDSRQVSYNEEGFEIESYLADQINFQFHTLTPRVLSNSNNEFFMSRDYKEDGDDISLFEPDFHLRSPASTLANGWCVNIERTEGDDNGGIYVKTGETIEMEGDGVYYYDIEQDQYYFLGELEDNGFDSLSLEFISDFFLPDDMLLAPDGLPEGAIPFKALQEFLRNIYYYNESDYPYESTCFSVTLKSPWNFTANASPLNAEQLLVQGAIEPFNIVVYNENVNDAPNWLELDNLGVNENVVGPVFVSNLVGSDPDDSSENLIYTLIDDGEGNFTIQNGDELWLAEGVSFDYEDEHEPSYNLTIRVSDGHGEMEADILAADYLDWVTAIVVRNVNEAPTNITSSGDLIMPENLEGGQSVPGGNFSAVDQDYDEEHSFALVEGDGRLAFEGSWLITTGEGGFDFETEPSITIFVRVTDSGENIYTKEFNITVTNVNEAPTNITLNGNSVSENAANGTVIGQCAAIDQDAGDTHAFFLEGDAEGRFSITQGGQLQVANGSALNFEDQSSWEVFVIAFDSQDNEFGKWIDIHLTNVNEAPTGLVHEGNLSLNENANAPTHFVSFGAVDEDEEDSHVFEVLGENAVVFGFDGPDLRALQSLNFETQNSYNIIIRVTDSGELQFQDEFVITVVNVNDDPVGNDDFVRTSPETTVVFGVLGNDTDEDDDALSVEDFGEGPEHGQLSFDEENQEFTYTPNDDFHGEDHFLYAVTDNEGGSDIVEVTISVGQIMIMESNDSSLVREGGFTDNYSISLTLAPVSNVVVNILPDAQSTTEPAQVTFTPENWQTPRIIVVTAVNDEDLEGDHLTTITHQTASEDMAFSNLENLLLDVGVQDNEILADAGDDIAQGLPGEFMLNGSASAGYGEGAIFQWQQLDGPTEVDIVDPNALSTSFIASMEGEYLFELTITATDNNQATDEVMFTIQDLPPVAVPSFTQTSIDLFMQDGETPNTVQLNAASSYDANSPNNPEAITQFYWNLVSGPEGFSESEVLNENELTAMPIFTPIVDAVYRAGVYKFDLYVYSGEHNTPSAPVRVVITVNHFDIHNPNAEGTVVRPTAFAGPNTTAKLVEGSVNITLKGHDSLDADSGATGLAPVEGFDFLWRLVSQPNGANFAFGGQNDEVDPIVTLTVAGPYVFGLTVTDNNDDGLDSEDAFVTITVINPENLAPGATAALQDWVDSNQDGKVNPGEKVNLAGAGSDPEGSALTFLWSQLSGQQSQLTPNENSQNVSFTPQVTGTYVFQLMVNDGVNNSLAKKVTVQVSPLPEENNPISAPVALAKANGEDTLYITVPTLEEIGLGTDPITIQLSGLLSKGRDGATNAGLVYIWKQIQGPNVTITGADTAQASFTPYTSRTYAFELTVSTADGLSATDLVYVAVSTTVNSVPRPQVNVSTTIDKDKNEIRIDLSDSADPDNPDAVLEFFIEQISGPAVIASIDLETLELVLEPNGPINEDTGFHVGFLAGEYAFIVTIDDGADMSPPLEFAFEIGNVAAPAAGGGSSSGGCFIATASLANGAGHNVSDQVASYYLTEERLADLNTLRAFRDNRLMKTAAGQSFVRWYYTHGPIAAQAIKDNEAAKFGVRFAIVSPLVAASKVLLWRPMELRDALGFAMLALYALIAIAVAKRGIRLSKEVWHRAKLLAFGI